MAVYEYECRTCGPFEANRPMAEYQQPCDCPRCGDSAPRAFLTAPAIAGMPAERRAAFATNERSAHEPRRHVHGPGCGCGSRKAIGKSKTLRAPNGAKSFPSKRPWMISH